MPKQITHRDYSCNAWAGTPKALADLFRRAQELIEQETGVEAGQSVTVRSRSKTDVRYESIEEFAAEATFDQLKRASEISCHIGREPLGAMFLLSASGGVRGGLHLRVSGTKSVSVVGVEQLLTAEIATGRRTLRISQLTTTTVLALGACGAVVAATLSYLKAFTAALIVLAVFVTPAALSLLMQLTQPLLVPVLEVLDPSDPRTKWQRSRGWLIGALTALAISVLGPLIVLLITN